MRSLLLERIFCVSALALSAGCSKVPAVPQLRDLPMVGFVQETSFDDHGLKALVFPRGVAFVMRFDTGGVVLEKVTLSTAEQQLLLDAINHHHVFGLPRQMTSRACDGSSVRVLCATAHHEHWIYCYASEDPDFRAFQKVFVDIVSISATSARIIFASDFVEGIAAEMEAFPKGSTHRNTAATYLDFIVRSRPPEFWGFDDTTRFTLPGKGPKLYRDLPAGVEEPFEEVPIEPPFADDVPLLDLPPSVVDNLLPEPAPIVIDLPVLD